MFRFSLHILVMLAYFAPLLYALWATIFSIVKNGLARLGLLPEYEASHYHLSRPDGDTILPMSADFSIDFCPPPWDY